MEYSRKLFLMQQAYATLFSLANKVQVRGDQYLRYMTSRQMMTFLAIGHLPEGEASLNNIARKMGTTKQSVKQLVSALEKKGYLTVQTNPRDRRAVNVVITQEGQLALLEDYPAGLEFFEHLFHHLSLEEIESLWLLLNRLYSFDGEEQDGFEGDMRLSQSISLEE